MWLGQIQNPHKSKIGDIFTWKNKLWRRGRGKIYRARPCVRGLIYKRYRQRERRKGR